MYLKKKPQKTDFSTERKTGFYCYALFIKVEVDGLCYSVRMKSLHAGI